MSTGATRKRLLIVAHAPSANTRALREAVEAGSHAADAPGVDAHTLSPFDAGPDDVLQADAVILGTTENLGYMSGALKDFFDRTYYGVLERKQGLPYALYVRAGHDGTGTMRGVATITTGLKWREVQPPLLMKGDWQPAFVDQARELGTLMATALDAGVV